MGKYIRAVKKVSSAIPAEPKHAGKWVRFDSRTMLFLKEGQDKEEVFARYRARPLIGTFDSELF